MFAALKDDVLEMIRYEGMSAAYPFWFQELIDDGYIYQDYPGGPETDNRGAIYSSDEGELAIVVGDIFMINRFGFVRHFTQEQFNDSFYECS